MRSNVGLALIFLAWASAWASTPRAEAQPLPAVSVRVVGPSVAGGSVRYSAELRSSAQVDVTFKVGGYIQELLQVPGADGQKRAVQEGDRVTKGTMLAQMREIDSILKVNKARAQLREARGARSQVKAQLVEAQAARERAAAQLLADQASFEKARLNFERSSNLFATQSLTTADLDASKAHFEEARARVEAARAQMALAQAHEERVKAQSQETQARVDGAEAQLDKEDLVLRDSALKAPFDGGKRSGGLMASNSLK